MLGPSQKSLRSRSRSFLGAGNNPSWLAFFPRKLELVRTQSGVRQNGSAGLPAEAHPRRPDCLRGGGQKIGGPIRTRLNRHATRTPYNQHPIKTPTSRPNRQNIGYPIRTRLNRHATRTPYNQHPTKTPTSDSTKEVDVCTFSGHCEIRRRRNGLDIFLARSRRSP